MTARINPRAGQPADASSLTNIPRLAAAYYSERPDPSIAEQRVKFGPSSFSDRRPGRGPFKPDHYRY